MRKPSLFALFLLTIILVGELFGQASHDWNASGRTWWKHVEYLASDELQGRNVGSPGYDKAAAYVAKQFAEAGLKAAGESGYFQPVEFIQSSLDATNSSLYLLRGSQLTAIAVPGEAELGYSKTSTPLVNAPIVFAGYGLVVPEARYDDLKGLPVKGAIVAFLTGGPDAINGNLRSHYSSGEERWKALRAAGAIGTISIPNPKSMEIPWNRQILAWGLPRMTLADSKTTGTEGQQFSASWNPAKADDLFAGSGHTFAKILSDASDQSPLPHFRLAARVKASVKISLRQVGSKNVVGVRTGVDRDLRDEYVVISAHLDHLGVGKPVNGDSIYNGAMDDASGVASLIEIAKSMQASDVQTKRSILFTAVTSEEKGELGSKYFVSHTTVRGQIVADLNMDMYLPLFPLKWLEVQGLNESNLGDDVRHVAEQAGVQVQADKEPNRNRFIRSDQYSFIKKGIPSLAFKFGYQPGDPQEKVFKEWYTNRYHGVKDDSDQPKDAAAAAQFNSILEALAVRVADAAAAPTWNDSSFFRRFASSQATQ